MSLDDAQLKGNVIWWGLRDRASYLVEVDQSHVRHGGKTQERAIVVDAYACVLQLYRDSKYVAPTLLLVVQFAPFQSLVQPAFWHALTEFKISVLCLSDDAQQPDASLGALEIPSAIQSQVHASLHPFFLVHTVQGQTSTAPVEECDTFFANITPEHCVVSFIDPSALPTNTSWTLRNLLAYYLALHPETVQGVRLLCWRDIGPPTGGWKSLFGIFKRWGCNDYGAAGCCQLGEEHPGKARGGLRAYDGSDRAD
ncbi:hypothetical protein L226DRAFT_573882 [Lentinus tigrinus ALCF2SS1-7]|uniref:uncharacterized protein n=1 Tax=Lentinus tigrinus ALCF2SS1-7 TaxID=1328758 RepID=UPI001165E199|nr:hypothetical protein L226DRAFT_573882 [Lentinus tigrinus ALCF2SS1-7]